MVEILTKDDLVVFKDEIISEIRAHNKTFDGGVSKKWLRSTEVKELLSCSHGTLQNMRTRGALKATKIGGIWYYPSKEVYSLLENGETII